jgi:hypothetical protein
MTKNTVEHELLALIRSGAIGIPPRETAVLS